MCSVGGEVGFGSDVIKDGSDGKTERRRDCTYQYLLVVEVERGRLVNVGGVQ